MKRRKLNSGDILANGIISEYLQYMNEFTLGCVVCGCTTIIALPHRNHAGIVCGILFVCKNHHKDIAGKQFNIGD